ncbi:hypothetical protein Taro_007709 [Colocasia esculenta]|uniref:Uncharacterized protein n=1 Tax=Colocasia esculenta TaxID=4460 RepID=A0A843U4Q8_COLES|nr:hypothetical protein [Colocasia esculenta]
MEKTRSGSNRQRPQWGRACSNVGRQHSHRRLAATAGSVRTGEDSWRQQQAAFVPYPSLADGGDDRWGGGAATGDVVGFEGGGVLLVVCGGWGRGQRIGGNGVARLGIGRGLEGMTGGEKVRRQGMLLGDVVIIAYEGKEMRVVADELKVINLHVSKLTVDWFSREEYEKFREDLQGKRIHIDAQSASTSKDKIRDIKLMQQSSTSSSIASMGDTYKQVLGRDRTRRVRGIGTGPTPKSLWGTRSEQKLRQDNESLKQQIHALEERMKKLSLVAILRVLQDSLVGRRVRILTFSRQVVASGILMSDDNDNVVMGKKLGGEYYEFVYCNMSWSKEKAS